LETEKALIWLGNWTVTRKYFKSHRVSQLSSSANVILLPGISKTEKGKDLQSDLEWHCRLLFSPLLLSKGCIIKVNI